MVELRPLAGRGPERPRPTVAPLQDRGVLAGMPVIRSTATPVPGHLIVGRRAPALNRHGFLPPTRAGRRRGCRSRWRCVPKVEHRTGSSSGCPAAITSSRPLAITGSAARSATVIGQLVGGGGDLGRVHGPVDAARVIGVEPQRDRGHGGDRARTPTTQAAAVRAPRRPRQVGGDIGRRAATSAAVGGSPAGGARTAARSRCRGDRSPAGRPVAEDQLGGSASDVDDQGGLVAVEAGGAPR